MVELAAAITLFAASEFESKIPKLLQIPKIAQIPV
jgi:hypothetical protein